MRINEIDQQILSVGQARTKEMTGKNNRLNYSLLYIQNDVFIHIKEKKISIHI